MSITRGKQLIISLVIVGVAGLGAVWIVANRQTIVDHFVAWQFHPSDSVAALVDKSGMSANGRFLYYASQPQLDGRTAFNSYCRSNNESQSAVLGCYANDRIYLFDVKNQELSGVKAVTAAHEMLHAAYARLSSDERTRVNAMLQREYQKVKDQADLKAVMKIYEQTEPGEADNELHSILGTEVPDLSPELEAYYKKYFTDRTKVVEAYASYQKVFTDLEKQAATIEKQLATLKTKIETASALYTSSVAQLQKDIADFNDRAKNGSFTSQSEFDSERQALEGRVTKLTSDRNAVNQMIDRYNSLNARLGELATRSQSLNQSINSSLPATPRLQ